MAPAAAPAGEPVFALTSADLADGGEVAFTFPDGRGNSVDGFCVRYLGRAHAFLNSCPHWGVQLDYDDGVFWDTTRRYLVCKNHGALFRADDGYCEAGPCFGGYLTRMPLVEEDGEVRVFAPPGDPEDWPA